MRGFKSGCPDVVEHGIYTRIVILNSPLKRSTIKCEQDDCASFTPDGNIP
jgi:hypothetical protein